MGTFKFHCPFCRQPIEAETAWLNRQTECPGCGRQIEIRQDTGDPVILSAKDVRPPQMEYKVLAQDDIPVAGKLNAHELEKTLNYWASEGWRVVSAVTESIAGILSHTDRDELIIILEREKKKLY